MKPRNLQGRTHKALVTLLEAEGFSNVEVHAAVGHWRSSPYADVVRWEGSALHRDLGIAVPVYSWDTMTACVRFGITVSNRNEGTAGMGFEISSKAPRAALRPA